MATNNDKCLLQDLAERLTMRSNIPQKQIDSFLKLFFEMIEEVLNKESIVKIKGFGTFKLVTVDKRESININTGERIAINSHSKIVFTPENSLKEYINRPFAHFQTVVLNEGTDIAEMENLDNIDEENELPLTSDEDDNSFETSIIQEETEAFSSVVTDSISAKPDDNIDAEVPVQTTEIEETPTATTCSEQPIDIGTTIHTESEVPPPYPSASKDDEPKEHKETRHSPNWWKYISLSFIVLLLMMLSYIAGYFRILCPCDYLSGWNIPQPTPTPKPAPDTIYIVRTASEPKDTVRKIIKEKIPEKEIKSIKTEEKPETKYKQLENRKYTIVGTMRQYTISKGETIRDIALAEYGSKGFTEYIIVHNQIKDPDLIMAGQKINLPRLVKNEK